MRGIIQSRTGESGTCFRASLASILNLRESQVPDFPEANQDPGVNKFLARRGLRYEEFPITPDNAPVGYYFILGVSPRGGEHAIVGKDGRPVWDPHPVSDGTGQGLIKPERYGVLVNEFKKAKDDMRPDDFCDGCDRPMDQCICEMGEFGSVKDARRARLHRALDCVMDRARAKDVSEQSLQVALTRAEKRVEAARNSVSLAVEARKNKGERLQSTREVKARSKLDKAHMEVYKAERALKDYGSQISKEKTEWH